MKASASTAGWYPDPLFRFAQRYWDGRRWTEHVADAGHVYVDPPPDHPSGAGSAEVAHLDYVLAFLDAARRAGACDEDAFRSLSERARRIRNRVVGIEEGAAAPAPARVAPAVPTVAPAPVEPVVRPVPEAPARAPVAPVPPPRPPVAPVPPAPPPPAPRPAHLRAVPPVPAVPPSPEPATRPAAAPVRAAPPSVEEQPPGRFARMRSRIAADLAIHWLAYLGVLFLFSGVFGLVAFSFSEVNVTLRPIAELAIPSSLFMAGWFLKRQRAPFASRIVTFLGGALLPIVAVASFTDGAGIPPDAHGNALALCTAATCFGISAVYFVIASRRPDTPLRFLAGPVLWLGVGLLALVTRTEIPSGSAVASVSGWQIAIMGASVPVTLALVRALRLRRSLVDAVEIGALAAAAVTVLFGVIAATSEGWPAGPVAVTGLAALLTVELATDRIGPTGTAMLELALAAGSIASLAPAVTMGWLGAIGVGVYLVLTEWTGWRRPALLATVAFLSATVCGLAFALVDPWPTVVAFSCATAWVHTRRLVRPAWLEYPEVLLIVAAIIPAGVVAGLFRAVDASVAFVTTAAAVAAVAIVVRIARATSDALWHWWVATAAGVVAIGTVMVWPSPSGWLVATAAALATVALVAAEMPAVAKVWAVSASGAWAAMLLLWNSGVAREPAAAVFAVAGFVMVLATVRRRDALAGNVGVIGHLLTIAAAVPSGNGVAGVVALGAFVAGWATTAALVETRAGSPVTALARRAATA
ncbi:MAG TPA: DUF2510 domain-containing protein [Acidimicrobiia bacterium]|nr:DUF2510 domain-containing protein [Acidimicrobiia bacterium]